MTRTYTLPALELRQGSVVFGAFIAEPTPTTIANTAARLDHKLQAHAGTLSPDRYWTWVPEAFHNLPPNELER